MHIFRCKIPTLSSVVILMNIFCSAIQFKTSLFGCNFFNKKDGLSILGLILFLQKTKPVIRSSILNCEVPSSMVSSFI
jgi:hypothetical protein